MLSCWKRHQDTLSAVQMQLHHYDMLNYLMIIKMCTLSPDNCAYLAGKTVNSTKNNNVVAARKMLNLSTV